MKPRFTLGMVVATPGALEVVKDDLELVTMLVTRHVCGDFGDICEEDANRNIESVKLGGRIMSVYKLFEAGTVWVITESDRSVTTLLTPAEY